MSYAVRSMEFQSFEMKTEAGSGDGTYWWHDGKPCTGMTLLIFWSWLNCILMNSFLYFNCRCLCMYLFSLPVWATICNTMMKSRDTCLVLRRLKTHIYILLSWLSLDVFMSCLGSILVAPCLVLALSHDCLSAYFTHDTYGLSTTVSWSLLSLLDNEARPVYLTVYFLSVDQQNNFTLMLNWFWLVSWHLCLGSVSSLEHFHYVSISSRPNPKCLGSSHVSIPLSWPMSLSQKNVSTQSLIQ